MKCWLEYTFVAITTTVIVAAFVLATYWAFIDVDPPLSYEGATLVTDVTGRATNRFRPGDTMLLTRHYCMTRAQSMDFDRRFVSLDGKVTYLSSTDTLNPILSCVPAMPEPVRATRAVVIPEYLPWGYWRFVTTGSYVNNPLTRGTVLAPAPVIEVVK